MSLERVRDIVQAAEQEAGRSLEHLVWTKFGIEQVNCKICGNQMSGLVETDRNQRVEFINGEKVIFRHLLHMRFPLYNEIKILFEDGSDHVTHVCVECVKKGLSIDQLKFLCIADLAQFYYHYTRFGGPPPWHHSPGLMDPKPKGYEELGGID